MGGLVVPGVQVTVVKEIVPPQLAPSGVLGLVGLTETGGRGHAASRNRFIELFGAASAFSLPEAALALVNGVSELVVSPVTSGEAKAASVRLPLGEGNNKEGEGAPALELTARAPGPWANHLKVSVVQRDKLDGSKVFDLTIKSPGSDAGEEHRDLVCKPGDARHVEDVIAKASSIVSAKLTNVSQTEPPKKETTRSRAVRMHRPPITRPRCARSKTSRTSIWYWPRCPARPRRRIGRRSTAL